METLKILVLLSCVSAFYAATLDESARLSMRSAGIPTILASSRTDRGALATAIDDFQPINATCAEAKDAATEACIACKTEKCRLRRQVDCLPRAAPTCDEIKANSTVACTFYARPTQCPVCTNLDVPSAACKACIKNSCTARRDAICPPGPKPDLVDVAGALAGVALGSIGNLGGAAIGGIGDLGGTAISGIGNLGNVAISGLGDLGGTIGGGLGDLGGTIGGGLGDLGGTIGGGLGDLGGTIGGGLGDLGGTIGGGLGDLGGTIIGGLGDLGGELEDLGGTIIGGIKGIFGKRKRRATIVEPTCAQIESDPIEACKVYEDGSFCPICEFDANKDCPGWAQALDRAVAADNTARWTTSATTFGYLVQLVEYDPTKFANGGFANVAIRTDLFGKTYSFSIPETLNLFDSAVTGRKIAEYTIREARAAGHAV